MSDFAKLYFPIEETNKREFLIKIIENRMKDYKTDDLTPKVVKSVDEIKVEEPTITSINEDI
jgi:hypothetical protein